MDELEAVEINFCKLNNEFRIDSEFFKKDILIYENRLNNYKLLKDLGTFLIGPFGSTVVKDNYVENSNNYYIRGLDIGDFFLKKPDAKIDDKLFNELTRFHVKFEDIFITVVGTLGKASIITDKNIKAVFSCKSTIFRSKINPYYLITFFNTDIGYKLLIRGKRGVIQEGLNLPDLQNIRVPIVSNNFQFKIETIVKSAQIKLEQSKSLYKEAEEILLKELDLLDFKPSQNNIAIKSFSESFLETGRLDSEYYQPKYDEVVEKIKSYEGGFQTLKYFSKSHSTGYPFKSDSYVNDGIYLIRINNIKKGHLDIVNATKIPYNNKDLSRKDIAIENDILISMSGTIGNSCKIPEGVEAVINQRIMKITSQNISFELLPLLINSLIGQIQLERIGTGGVQTNISSSDIFNILIPIIQNSIQMEIENKIQTSFQLKSESKELLKLAKRAVEVAIEEGEEVALEMLR